MQNNCGERLTDPDNSDGAGRSVDNHFNHSLSYIQPDWPVSKKVKSVCTTRIGGNSLSPFGQFNLANHVGDYARIVQQNRARLAEEFSLNRAPLWLEQNHGTNVVNAAGIDVIELNDKFQQTKQPPLIHADACYSGRVNDVCVVMTADCLPILLADKEGSWVAAVHAGWRGLVNGIVQKSIAAYPYSKSNLIAWLGPAISHAHFEVGEEVKSVFLKANTLYSDAFVESGQQKHHCDLYLIAKMLLADDGIESYGGGMCTFTDAERFYSYRRDGQTGRMASLVWIEN